MIEQTSAFLPQVFQIAVASTLPVPSGMLIPLFKVGAAFGRQIGELMVTLFPLGIVAGFPIVPGEFGSVIVVSIDFHLSVRLLKFVL